MPRPKSKRGFTLIELLVVIAIIAILVALLLPAVQQVREAARKSQCQNHLHNMAIAMHSYEGTFGCWPVGVVPEAPANYRGASWMVRLLPFVEQKPAFDQMTFDGTDWSNQNNIANHNWQVLSELRVAMYNCPSSPLSPIRVQNMTAATQALGAPATVPIQLVNYVGISGSYNRGSDLNCCPEPSAWTGYYRSNYNGVIVSVDSLSPNPVRMASISDGTSNTVCVGEQGDKYQNADLRACNHDGGPWTAGQGGSSGWWLNVTVVRNPINYKGASQGGERAYYRHTVLNSTHPGGAQMALSDGVVRFFSENLDYSVMTRLCDRADGQPTGSF